MSSRPWSCNADPASPTTAARMLRSRPHPSCLPCASTSSHVLTGILVQTPPTHSSSAHRSTVRPALCSPCPVAHLCHLLITPVPSALKVSNARMPSPHPFSYPILQAKPSTHRMCAQHHLFHTHGYKVFTNSQVSRIKYIYYINNVSKD
jgi:hypothetical protein